MKILKRDGRQVEFNRDKIVNAVLAAFKEVDGEVTDYAINKANNIADYVLGVCKEKDSHVLSVEKIQDYVEKGLMSLKRKDVAKAYILYREERSKVRARKTSQMKAVERKLFAKDVQNQNANVDEHSFGGRMGEAADVIMKQFALDNLLSPMARKNHLDNEIYIHDLSHYALGDHNCLSIPFDDLLAKGFNTRQTDVRPAGSVNTAFQLIAVIFQLQSLQQFGRLNTAC